MQKRTPCSLKISFQQLTMNPPQRFFLICIFKPLALFQIYLITHETQTITDWDHTLLTKDEWIQTIMNS